MDSREIGVPNPRRRVFFCKAIGSINNGSYNKSMQKTRVMGGAENRVYSAAYIISEKKRVWEKKPKIASRKKIEEQNPIDPAIEDLPGTTAVTNAMGNRGTEGRSVLGF